jgi:hypothetical protein
MTDTRPKFTLNLNETNSLGFTMSIEGSSSDIDATSPEFRFVLAEQSGEKAWLYPMEKDEEGDMVVSIPSESIFSENKDYVGQVEVILGNHYFIPTTVDIEFIKPLKVEAVAKVKSQSAQELNEISDGPLRIASVTARTKNKVKKETVAKVEHKPVKLTPKKKQWSDLSEAEQAKVKEVLRARKMKQLREAKAAAEKKKKLEEARKRKAEKMAKGAIKDQLKSLMSNSLLEEE